MPNYLVDPTDITDYNLTVPELELTLLFWIFAAGKNGKTAAKCLENLLNSWHQDGLTPFQIIKRIPDLPQELRKHGVGCFNNKARTLKELLDSNIDLKDCSVDDLEEIKGIGCKTSRCFLIHSRQNQKLAGLDRHVLKFLDDLGYQVPKSTPTKKKYKDLESLFLSLTNDSAKLDLEIWNAYMSKDKEKQKELIERFK